MSKKTLTGRTEILAAIYNPEHLPSASLLADGSAPYCLHSLRTEGLAFFDKKFMCSLRAENGHHPDDVTHDEELKCTFYPFVEEAPYFTMYNCTGCYLGENTDGHRVDQSEEVSKKTCEECA